MNGAKEVMAERLAIMADSLRCQAHAEAGDHTSQAAYHYAAQKVDEAANLIRNYVRDEDG